MKFVCEVPTAEPTLRRWLERGDAIGVFQNVALDSHDRGRLVFLPLDPEDRSTVTVGKTQAPDHPSIGLGWRYILQAVEHTMENLEFKEPEPEPEAKPGRRRKKR